MPVIFIIGTIIFIIYKLAGNNKPTPPNVQPYTEPKQEKPVIVPASPRQVDEAKRINIEPQSSMVIDVTGQNYKINTGSIFKKHPGGVPYWAHHYVYSHSELNGASDKQRAFYSVFKAGFLRGAFYDLEGNLNYAFILLFDLLDEYDQHKDLPKLENQLHLLGLCYPKTKSYGESFLYRKKNANRKEQEASVSYSENQYSYQADNGTYYEYWKLGNKYKSGLELSSEEVKLLNKLWFPHNNFCSMETCLKVTLRLYISVMRELEAYYVSKGTNSKDQFDIVTHAVATKHNKFRKGSQNYMYCVDNVQSQIYSYIFKHCENAVREHYGHKRKINTDTPYTTPEVKAAFENIIADVTTLFPALIISIEPPDEATDIELYTQNTSRWKIKFEQLTSTYNEDHKAFIESIVTLGKLNKNNPSVENIFYEASKFMAKHDSESALLLYVHYLHHDLKSATFDNKQLTKTIQKNLFKTNEQLHSFEMLVSDLINDKDLDKALKAVPGIYKAKRKKIRLDTSAIKEVQEQHSGTVELLNEYLQDDFEDEHNTIKSQEISSEEIRIEITQKQEEATSSAYTNELAFTPVHVTMLDLFSKQNFSVHQDELETFARSKGLFKNQLVESINDLCYDFLDDVLIEEEDDYYAINSHYFQKISAI